jgi:F-type H+-transporting ATPase subunit alpha
MAVERQVLVLYSLTHGFLDDIAISDIQRFQNELTDFVAGDKKYVQIYNEIIATGDLPDTKLFDGAINEFKSHFVKSEEPTDYVKPTEGAPK